ncbi:MAG: xylulokinase, partial [Actinobacteria bacterium]|nr:xylulokinase [Actinomycetota bacterium]NIV57872.1 xylulokinase [Actinomycetota bacterium]NIX52669.1 xylulokinase [Actinomycetota bacterium]
GAGGTLMLDLRTRDWSADLLEALDLSPAMLPPTFEGTEPTGAISPAAAAATGLRQGTPVFAGGGD